MAPSMQQRRPPSSRDEALYLSLLLALLLATLLFLGLRKLLGKHLLDALLLLHGTAWGLLLRFKRMPGHA